jgi:hypothetical protein
VTVVGRDRVRLDGVVVDVHVPHDATGTGAARMAAAEGSMTREPWAPAVPAAAAAIAATAAMAAMAAMAAVVLAAMSGMARASARATECITASWNGGFAGSAAVGATLV